MKFLVGTDFIEDPVFISGSFTFDAVTGELAIAGGGGGGPGLVDGDYGDVAISGSGTVMTVEAAPISGITGLGAGVATFLVTPSSANLLAAVTNETGTGALVFATSPALITPNLGTPTALVLTNATGLPEAGVTGLTAALALKAPLASPTLTGTPLAPTATGGTNTTQIATTAFVTAAVAGAGAGDDWGIVTASPTTTYQATGLVGNTIIKLALGGNTAISPPTSSTFGTSKRFYVLYELTATGADRTPTFSSHTVTGGVTPLQTITSGDMLQVLTYTDDNGSTTLIQGQMDISKLPTVTPDPVADYLLLSDDSASDAQGKVLAGDLMPVVTISGSTTLTKAAHQGRILNCTAVVSLTVNNSTDFDVARGCQVLAQGGAVTVVNTATVDIPADTTRVIASNSAGAIVRKTTADTYQLFGGLVPA